MRTTPMPCMPRKLRNHRVSVSLTEPERKALERIAARSNLSISRTVQEALREFMVSHETEKVDVFRQPRRFLKLENIKPNDQRHGR